MAMAWALTWAKQSSISMGMFMQMRLSFAWRVNHFQGEMSSIDYYKNPKFYYKFWIIKLAAVWNPCAYGSNVLPGSG